MSSAISIICVFEKLQVTSPYSVCSSSFTSLSIASAAGFSKKDVQSRGVMALGIQPESFSHIEGILQQHDSKSLSSIFQTNWLLYTLHLQGT